MLAQMVLLKSTDGGNTWANIEKGLVLEGINWVEPVKCVSMSASQDNGSSILNAEGWLEFYGADGRLLYTH